MVMPANFLAMSPEFERVKADLIAARENYTALVEEYTQLINVVGPNLESIYMMKLGRKEHALFSCRIEIQRLKREISLFQTAVNRNESISVETVNKIIEKEFAEYRQQLEAQQEKLRAAQIHFSAEKWSDEEVREFKKIYHNIVRKLHPDLNPHLPEGAKQLWHRIQTAYKNNCWSEFFILADAVDEMQTGRDDYVGQIDSLASLREELEKILKKISDLKNRLEDTRKHVPFSYEKILSSPVQINAKRFELDKQLAICQEHLKTLKEIRSQY